jgi:TCP-1/cpn60 chaperonin family
MTKLRAAHADNPGCSIGINGETGEITDMKELGIWEPAAVKLQTFKTSVESAVLLLRIDDILSGMKKAGRPAASKPATDAGGVNEGEIYVFLNSEPAVWEHAFCCAGTVWLVECIVW